MLKTYNCLWFPEGWAVSLTAWEKMREGLRNRSITKGPSAFPFFLCVCRVLWFLRLLWFPHRKASSVKLDPWGVQLLDTSRHCPLGCEGTGNQLHYSLQVYQLINIAVLRVRGKMLNKKEGVPCCWNSPFQKKIVPSFVAWLLPDLSSGALGCNLAVNALLGGDSLAEACRPLPWWAGQLAVAQFLKAALREVHLKGEILLVFRFFLVFEFK